MGVFEKQRSTKIFQSILTYIEISSTQSKRPRFVVIKMLKLVVVCALVVFFSLSPNSAKPSCEVACPRIFEPPVCGTDGNTYAGTCALDSAACKTQNPDLAVAYEGQCKGDDMKAARSLGGCQTCPTQCPTWPNCTLQDYGITSTEEESEPAPR